MNKIELAKSICLKAHEGQVDKGGNEYYHHPFTVAKMCESEAEKIVAYLHDVVEDSRYTLEDIKELGFDQSIIEALSLMTHDTSLDYDSYIKRLSKNPIARHVKLNDLKHNSDLSRLKSISDKDIQRVAKYKKYIELLKEVDKF